MSSCVQITPAYPPDISGVGDYASLVAEGGRGAEWPVVTLVARTRKPCAATSGGALVLNEANATALAEALDGARRVLLHFSGYGYARRGLCRWLVDALASWKSGGNGLRLVTMFHEVYATGPIWQSSFWTASPQRRIAKGLAQLSDAAFVSSDGGRDQLARLVPELQVELLPVFSNVGEPEAPKPLSDRSGRAVVFGGQTRRGRVYAELGRVGSAVAHHLRQTGVTEILDIGPAMEVPEQIAGCPVRVLGPLLAEEVSAALSNARLGLIDYPGHVFTKSGIAAAYFAHRLPVVNTSSVGGFPPDLQEGRQFVGLERFARGDFDAQAVADAGLAWYRPHGVAATAEKFQACLA